MQKAATPQHNDIVRQRVIDYATQQFFEFGIRDVTMDAISQGLKMSKRTLYQLFSDKEQLIIACIEKELARSKEMSLKMIEEKQDVITIILSIIGNRLQIFKKMSPKFTFDIEHYPQLKAFFETFKQEFYTEGAEFLRQGAVEGSLRSDINFDIAVRYIYQNNMAFTRSTDFQAYKIEEIFFNTGFTFLRGCCTPKGLAALEQFYQKYMQEDNA